jgi:hypothetical protein
MFTHCKISTFLAVIFSICNAIMPLPPATINLKFGLDSPEMLVRMVLQYGGDLLLYQVIHLVLYYVLLGLLWGKGTPGMFDPVL